MATISIVMAVFNGAATLDATMNSILSQTERDFEVIVVNDGSTDATASMLADFAKRDPRVRVLDKPRGGLTSALIDGCEAAAGALIARHDCGDVSHPDRLARQKVVFDRDPETVLVSCTTRFRAPGGEPLYETGGDGDDVRHSLLHESLGTIRGLSHHGSAMFRASAYRSAGGYRREFRVAQDLDLWIRLARLGRIAFVDEVLYEATVEPRSISGRRRGAQIAAARIALALRDEPRTERRQQLLESAADVTARERRAPRTQEARTLYFIASCLHRAGNRRWRHYARRAIRRSPLLLRAWALFLRWR